MQKSKHKTKENLFLEDEKRFNSGKEILRVGDTHLAIQRKPITIQKRKDKIIKFSTSTVRWFTVEKTSEINEYFIGRNDGKGAQVGCHRNNGGIIFHWNILGVTLYYNVELSELPPLKIYLELSPMYAKSFGEFKQDRTSVACC